MDDHSDSQPDLQPSRSFDPRRPTATAPPEHPGRPPRNARPRACAAIASAVVIPLAFLLIQSVSAASAAGSEPPSDPSSVEGLLSEPFLTDPGLSEDAASRRRIAAFTSQGIPPERAAQALALQERVTSTGLARDVERTLGSAFAGMWFDNAAPQLHVGVTSSQSRRTIEEIVERSGLTDDVTITPVRSTWAELLTAQESWRQALGELRAKGQAATGVSADGNAVTITLSPTVGTATLAVLKNRAARADVNVSVSVGVPPGSRAEPEAVSCTSPFVSEKSYCEKTLASGVRTVWNVINKGKGKSHKNKTLDGFAEATLTQVEVGDTVEGPGIPAMTTVTVKPNKTSVEISNAATTEEEAEFTFKRRSLCTPGPMLIKGFETYMVTSGHCYSKVETAMGGEAVNAEVSSEYTKGGGEKEVGKEAKRFYREPDIAEVKIKRPGEFAQALPTPVPAELAQWGPPVAPHVVTDEEASLEGQMNCHEGATSGEQCGTVGNPNNEGLVEDTACSEGGDSGGPWFLRQIISGEDFIILMQGAHKGKEEKEEVKCGAVPQLEEEVQTNNNTSLTGLKAIGTMKVGWAVFGNGIVKRTEVTEIKEVKPGEWTVVISIAATTKEKVKLVFKPFYRTYYVPMTTIRAKFPRQRLLTTANETRKPRVRGPKGGALTKKSFTGTSGATTIETKEGSQLTCTADTGKGEASAESTGTTKLTLTGCQAFGEKCRTSGAAEGEVVLSANYKLAYTNGAEDEVGLVLELTEATIECGAKNCEGKAAQTLKLRGAVIGAATPINEEVAPPSKFAIAFSQTKGTQKPTEYEKEEGAKTKAILELSGSGKKAFGFEQTGLASTEELLFEETAEIEA
jgi:hypothetical protein